MLDKKQQAWQDMMRDSEAIRSQRQDANTVTNKAGVVTKQRRGGPKQVYVSAKGMARRAAINASDKAHALSKVAESSSPAIPEGRAAHKAAGEAHLAAAHANMQSGAKFAAGGHVIAAAEHASAAGSDWDESKHPRDENGKFG